MDVKNRAKLVDKMMAVVCVPNEERHLLIEVCQKNSGNKVEVATPLWTLKGVTLGIVLLLVEND